MKLEWSHMEDHWVLECKRITQPSLFNCLSSVPSKLTQKLRPCIKQQFCSHLQHKAVDICWRSVGWFWWCCWLYSRKLPCLERLGFAGRILSLGCRWPGCYQQRSLSEAFLCAVLLWLWGSWPDRVRWRVYQVAGTRSRSGWPMAQTARLCLGRKINNARFQVEHCWLVYCYKKCYFLIKKFLIWVQHSVVGFTHPPTNHASLGPISFHALSDIKAIPSLNR